MKSRTFLFTSLTLISLLLAACKVNVGTTVDSTGAGELQTEIGFTAEELQSLTELSGGDAENICDTLQSEAEGLPPDATFTQEERGDETYCITARPFADLDELRSLYDEMDGVTINELSLENGRLVYDVDVDLSDADAAGLFALSMEWRLTVPGSVGEHNADEVDGKTLIWTLTPGETINLRAESTAGLFGLDSTTIWIVAGLLLCCLCLVVIAGGAAAFFLLRRKPSAPVAPSDAPTVA
jgi:hypothetical protein